MRELNDHELCLWVKLGDNFSVFQRIWMKNYENFLLLFPKIYPLPLFWSLQNSTRLHCLTAKMNMIPAILLNRLFFYKNSDWLLLISLHSFYRFKAIPTMKFDWEFHFIIQFVVFSLLSRHISEFCMSFAMWCKGNCKTCNKGVK